MMAIANGKKRISLCVNAELHTEFMRMIKQYHPSGAASFLYEFAMRQVLADFERNHPTQLDFFQVDIRHRDLPRKQIKEI